MKADRRGGGPSRHGIRGTSRRRGRRLAVGLSHRIGVSLLGFVPGVGLAAGLGSGTNWTYTAELAFRETYDSNVYLQDAEPDYEKVPTAAPPFAESFVTSVTPKLGLGFKSDPLLAASFWYAPEMAFYHSEPSEDYVAHRLGLRLAGEVGRVPWTFDNSLNWVDGSGEGLYFGAPGGVPAIGGIPIRDRRDQLMYRGRASGTWDLGRWWVRPGVSGYWHDFRIEQKDATDPAQPMNRYYENYIDRRELNLGVDLGYNLDDATRVFLGYRYGWEVQGRLAGSPYHYDAVYHRPEMGIEGRPWKWLQAQVALGPDIHHTIHEVAPGFEPDYTTLWVDGVVTITPTATDSVVLTCRQNTQPAFAGSSVYDDITYDAVAKHRFGDHWTVSGGFRLYIGDWFAPVIRDDWIYTVSAGIGYSPDPRWSMEAGYSYDWVDSQVPGTPGRAFTRNLVWLGGRWAW